MMRFFKRKPDKISLLIVSDLQVGSAFGIFPEGFTLSTGSEYNLNTGQRYLWDCWQHMLKAFPKPDVFILNGEATDGLSKKLLGRYRVEPDPQWQVSAAVELVKPFVQEAGEVYVTKGTDYHTRPGGEDDEDFGIRMKEFGAVPSALGHYAHDWLLLDKEGVTLDIAHARSVMIRYETTAGERELQSDAMSADLKEAGASDLIVRSHGHRYVKGNVDGELFVLTPCWSLQTEYAARSKWPNRWISRLIGGVQVDIYPKLKTGDPRQNREEFIHIKGLTYPHPRKGRLAIGSR